MSDFVSFPLFGFILVIKLRNFDFEGHENTLMLFGKKIYVFRLNVSHGKMSDFVSFPLFVFTLFIKLRDFDFEGHLNTLMFFDKKNDVIFGYVLSNSV